MQDAQTLDNHLGKVMRVGKDGSVPRDNPFVNRAGALPEIWSFGHRNPQGATLGPDGGLWIHEHGPQGGDEINLPQPGRNYGWPVITFGEQYGGGPIGAGITAKVGMEQPLHHWTPSIAPSGMAFLTSDRYGSAWKGSLFVGSLKFQFLDRIELGSHCPHQDQQAARSGGLAFLRGGHFARQHPPGTQRHDQDRRSGRAGRRTSRRASKGFIDFLLLDEKGFPLHRAGSQGRRQKSARRQGTGTQVRQVAELPLRHPLQRQPALLLGSAARQPLPHHRFPHAGLGHGLPEDSRPTRPADRPSSRRTTTSS
jgi:hypothetical protein